MFEYKDLRYLSHKTSNEDTNYQIQIWPNIYLYHPGMFVLARQRYGVLGTGVTTTDKNSTEDHS